MPRGAIIRTSPQPDRAHTGLLLLHHRPTRTQPIHGSGDGYGSWLSSQFNVTCKLGSFLKLWNSPVSVTLYVKSVTAPGSRRPQSWAQHKKCCLVFAREREKAAWKGGGLVLASPYIATLGWWAADKMQLPRPPPPPGRHTHARKTLIWSLRFLPDKKRSAMHSLLIDPAADFLSWLWNL